MKDQSSARGTGAGRACALGLGVWLVACGGAGGGGSRVGEPALAVGGQGAEPLPALARDAWGKSGPARPGALLVHTDPGELPHLELGREGAQRLPLQHTHVSAKISGFVADVEVRQTYENPEREPIEITYVFPLPENSAVDAMKMQIGDRTIEGHIERRAEARRIYEGARRAGHTAALLEQERPNVFTESVTNVAPGKKIDVVVHYVQDLTYDAGEYEFVFPMVVGPRFSPGEALAGASSGTGTHLDTRQVPDASRISPPIVGQGERSGHDVSIDVTASSGTALGEVTSPTHDVSARKPADGTVRLTLAEKESLPNRDFVLRWRAADAQPKATLYAAPAGKGGYFSLVVQPPELDVERLVGRRELIFVVDTSGSMSGAPLGLCRSAMRDALSRLRPVDTFNLVTFAGTSRQAFEAPRPANDANVREALQVVDEMQAGGGTMMSSAIDLALSSAVERGRERYVFFLTDGYVGNEEEILAKTRSFVRGAGGRERSSRVFGFGVGSSVNRYLIDGLGDAGNGLSVYVTTREEPARAVNQFFHYVDRPVLTDVRVHFGDLEVSEIYPREVPDLFASHPLVLHGRYQDALQGGITVTARAGDETLTLPVKVERAVVDGEPSGVFGNLWARSKIADLEGDLWDGSNPQSAEGITRLGLDFHLVTRFTSFVAVDRSERVSSGAPRRVVQPVEAPEGVEVERAGGVRTGPPAAGQTVARAEDKDGVGDVEDPNATVQPSPAPPPSPDQPASGSFAAQETSAEVYAVDRRSAGHRGCGCRVGPSAPPSEGGAVAVGVLALGLALRRRRGAR